ncbi:unnamed protein product [Urochloa decumbens]|uniref:Uncharacterized protein n=1 Tax=Urochloa decumbens TaxID=240449 RepID=A0ABC9BU88_9POAL
MASSSSSLSLPLQLPRYGASSSRVRLRALHRSSLPSVQLRQPARGLRTMAAVSYHDEAAGQGDDTIAATTSTLSLRQVVDDASVAAELRAARAVGRAGKPKEGGGGNGGKIHPVTMSAAKLALRLPKEGSGGQGGSIH